MTNVVIDFETYYDQTVSVTTMGTYGYTRHEATRPYMVSIVAGSQQYVGSVDDFDWASIAGPNFQWWAHNASFDVQVYMRLHEEDPKAFPLPVNPPMCSADLCAYLGLPRSLAGAVHAVFGEKLSKGVRDNMKGKMPEDLDAEGREELRKYALMDSVWAHRLVEKLAPDWPESERRFSLLTREMGWVGLKLDVEGIEKDIANLKQKVWEARQLIPWAETGAALSPKALAMKCREVGIPAPLSLAMDSDECAEWEDLYGEKFPWVNAMRTVRRCNALQKKLETMLSRVMPNGRMNFEMRYCGAHTRRDSGGGGINVQNFPSKEIFGVDLRARIVAPPGKKLCVADKSQIEPRCLNYLVRDFSALEKMAAGVSPYIVHARDTMGLGPDEVWPKDHPLYKLAKARVLGLGYGCGHRKFLWMATNIYDAGECFDREVTRSEVQAYIDYAEWLGAKEWLAEWKALPEKERLRYVVAKGVVDDFREKSPLIVNLWKTLGEAAKEAASRKEDLVLELPDGSALRYRNMRFRGNETYGQVVKNGVISEVKLYGGLLTENLTQAMARQAFRDDVLRVSDAGYFVNLRVHDELVTEVDADRAEECKEEIEHLMGIPPTWAPRLPVAAEAKIVDHYCK